MLQPWKLLLGGLFRGWLAGAVGGFSVGLIRGSLWPDFYPVYIVIAVPLFVAAGLLAVRAYHLTMLALARRAVTGRWYIARYHPFMF